MSAPLPLTAADLACFDDLDLFAGETASDLETLEQDVYHMLIETPGSNLDDLNRGIGIEEMLSGPDILLEDVSTRIETELLKDDRIDGASATISKTGADSYELELTIAVGAQTLGLSLSYSSVGGLVKSQ